MGQVWNRADSNLVATNIKNGVTIFGILWTYEALPWWLPSDTVSMLAAFQSFNWRDVISPILTVRIWFIETASHVYAAIAHFSINNPDDRFLYRMRVQKFDKTTGELLNTYISNPILRSDTSWVAAWDCYLRVDATVFYAVLDSDTFRYISFDTATDTFSATSTTWWLQERGVFDILSTSNTADATLSVATIQLYTTALSSWANLWSWNAPDTLTVWSNTWGITYYSVVTYFNWTDSMASCSVLAFVTRT